jgi:hypothetical protein
VTKFCDLALLSLIYPFAVTSEDETVEILNNVEYHLVKDKGVIRYKLDRYYNNNIDGYSEEAEWCFGSRGSLSSTLSVAKRKRRTTGYAALRAQ